MHCRRAACVAADASGSPQVVPIHLDEIDALSSVRIYIPKDLRQADARALGLKVLPQAHIFFLLVFVFFLLLFLSSSSSFTAPCTSFYHTAASHCFAFVFLLTDSGRVDARALGFKIDCIFYFAFFGSSFFGVCLAAEMPPYLVFVQGRLSSTAHCVCVILQDTNGMPLSFWQSC